MRDGGYRTPEQIDAWKARDPISQLSDRLVSEEVATVADLEKIESEVVALVQEGVAFAESSPWPEASTVMDHIFSSGT